jgi:thiamine pyrophosphate-dependent acetolactate synthase large subunit-like protein
MSKQPSMTVGDSVVAGLERLGVAAAFGVVSIHNMPILAAEMAKAVRTVARRLTRPA